MDYLKLLEDSYKMELYEHPKTERLEFLGEAIFGFTTYEQEYCSLMAKKAIEVCWAITDGFTFDYIKQEGGELWYLLMVNMPFFEDKLEWGTSIRCAWCDLHAKDSFFTIESCFLFDEEEQIIELKLGASEWIDFIRAMAEFVKTNKSDT